MPTSVKCPKHILEGSSELWVRKMLAWFRLYDEEKTGYIEETAFVSGFNERLLVEFTEEQRALMPEIDTLVWNYMYAPVTKSVDGKKLIKWDDWLALRFDQVFNHPEREKEVIRQTETTFMKMADKNKDGFVTYDEFRAAIKVWGATEYQARILMTVMDTNMDGLIQVEEDVDFYTRFHMSTDFDRGAFGFGTLPSDPIEFY